MWIRENADRLESLTHLTIADPEVLEYLDEIQSHYDSLWGAARENIHNWGPAANSKALHQLIPGLFVCGTSTSFPSPTTTRTSWPRCIASRCD